MPDERRPPRASEAKVNYHLKQLLKMFARANDAAFLQMTWAVDALQSGREALAKRYISTYPPQAAAESSIVSPFGIHRWELETLIVQLFLVPKELPREQGNLVLDCSKFESIRQRSTDYARSKMSKPRATCQVTSLSGARCIGSRNGNFIGSAVTSISLRFIATPICMRKENALTTSSKLTASKLRISYSRALASLSPIALAPGFSARLQFRRSG
jgi:hypothetical protein